MKLTVYGSRGFIGSHIMEYFEGSEGDPNTPANRNILYLISTTHNYNIVDDKPFTDVNTNLCALIDRLEYLRECFGNDFTFNFASSWFVYGKTETPAREDSYCNPTGFYSITKRTAEQLLISYCEYHKINYRIFRFANVMGRGDRCSLRKNATQEMIKMLVNGKVVNLYEGRVLRDFIDVRDLVRAIEAVLTKGRVNETYNIGNGVGIAVEDVVQFASDLLKCPHLVNRVPIPEFHKQVQAQDMVLDINKLRGIGFTDPWYEVGETVRDLIEYYENEKYNSGSTK